MDFSTQLNQPQLAAVKYCDGPELVIAGAGSGKTRVLTYKIAYLLEKGMAPWTILALTFTNKAAREMEERIVQLVGQEKALGLRMGTFHSVFSRILRIEAENIGFTSSFTIYDEDDSRSLLKSIIKEMGLDDKKYKPANVHKVISRAKDHLILPENYGQDRRLLDRDERDGMRSMSAIYAAYQSRLLQAQAMDFDDLLLNTWRLFRDHEDVRKKYSDRFNYVLVDEFQDTNSIQQRIVSQLTKEKHRVCAVGDDYQSIYAFRGANIDNILNFDKTYPDMKLFKLEQNYRSTQSIVAAANSLMKHNSNQIKKNVFSKNTVGDKLNLKYVYSDQEEAAVVCKEILRLKAAEHADYSDFAILYRTNAQSRSFEKEMRHLDIPYRIFGGLSFYQRKEIKDIISYFRLIVNPNDEEAFKRIINYPARGIGNTTVDKVITAAQTNGISLWNVINSVDNLNLNVNRGTLAKLQSFRDLIAGFASRLHTDNAFDLGTSIIRDTGIAAEFSMGDDPETVSRRQNVEEFASSLSDFVETREESGQAESSFLPDFLQEVALMTDLDSDDNSDSHVALMTVHAAKGLEFPVVFVVGLEDSIFPSQMSMDSPRGLEEERRLLYVAITRAERHCYLTSAKMRKRYGTPEFLRPSRFLADIDPRYVESNRPQSSSPSSAFGRSSFGGSSFGGGYQSDKPYTGSHDYGNGPHWGNNVQNSRPVADRFVADPKPKITAPRRPEAAVDPLSARTRQRLMSEGGNKMKMRDALTSGGRAESVETAGKLHVGSVVEHTRFGIGKVIKIEGTGENTKAAIEFENCGPKQLLLKFARIKIVG